MAAAAVCYPNGEVFESALTKISGRKRSCSDEYYFTAPTKKVCFRSGDYTFTVTDSGSVESTPHSNKDNDNHRNAFNGNAGRDPNNKAEWVDLIIKEMMFATSVDDAKSRASRLLDDVVDKFAPPAATAAGGAFVAAESRSIEALSKENSVLKRAVVIQHQRQEKRAKETQELKELVKKYEDQVRNLEMDKYGLAMHLQQALCSTAIPTGFPPRVF